MLELNVMGEKIFCCNTAEAKRMWREQPDNRHQIWSEEEVSAHMLATPEELADLLARKKAKPGKL